MGLRFRDGDLAIIVGELPGCEINSRGSCQLK